MSNFNSATVRLLVSLVVFTGIVGYHPVISADPPPQPTGKKTSDEQRVEVRALVDQLNDDKFSVRQSASTRLAEMGQDVIPDLVKAAQGPHLEVTTRSLSLLEGFLKSQDFDTSQAAREALEELRDTEHKAASGGAREVMKRYDDQSADPSSGLGGVIQLRPAIAGQRQFQIQIQGGIAGGVVVRRQIRKQQANGVTTINVVENDTEIKIVDKQGKEIRIDVTTGKGDQRKTKKYAAKNVDELKKKHPEAHRLYQKYAGKNVARIAIPPAVQPAEGDKAQDAAEAEGAANDHENAPTQRGANKPADKPAEKPPEDKQELDDVRRQLQDLIDEVEASTDE